MTISTGIAYQLQQQLGLNTTVEWKAYAMITIRAPSRVPQIEIFEAIPTFRFHVTNSFRKGDHVEFGW
jgi:carotenoid cleavage dioxygenase-like enzyme